MIRSSVNRLCFIESSLKSNINRKIPLSNCTVYGEKVTAGKVKERS